jgi:hypothetical protein
MKFRTSFAEIRLDVLGLFLAGLNNTFLALFVAVVIHGPGTIAQESELMMRANWITENIILWKAGWLFWFAPTLSFSWSYYALGRNLDSPRQWYNLAIGVALIAAAVDIVGIMVNLTVLPELASELVATIASPDLTMQSVFLSMEKIANNLTNVAGYGLYSLAGILLLPAVFATPDFPRLLLWVGVAEWTISCIATAMLVLVPSHAIIPLVISFALYAPWVWGSAWWLLRRKKLT